MTGGFGTAMRAGFGSGDGDGDPSIPASSPLFFDGSSPRGDFVAPAGSRKILLRPAIGVASVVITHPDVFIATTQVLIAYRGNSTVSPEATRRSSARVSADGTITTFISSGAVAGDGALVLTIEVI